MVLLHCISSRADELRNVEQVGIDFGREEIRFAIERFGIAERRLVSARPQYAGGIRLPAAGLGLLMRIGEIRLEIRIIFEKQLVACREGVLVVEIPLCAEIGGII